MACDCSTLRDDMVNLSKDILVEEDKMLQWAFFKQFLRKYKKKNSQSSFQNEVTFCSQKICSFVDHKSNEFIHSDMALSTLLVDLLTVLYFEFCARRHVKGLWDTPFQSIRGTLRVIGALERGWWSSDFMKLLLNFGFLSSLPIDSPHLIKALDSQLSIFISDTAGGTPNTFSYRLTEKAMELVEQFFFPIKDGENFKRTFLVAIALRCTEISLRRMRNNQYWNYDLMVEHFIGSLRMYFSGTRDALISVFEVRSILYASFQVTDKLHLFDMYCQEFDKLMPECPAKMEPRKLTHLARCQIRQNLNGSHLPLPSAINKLHLPKSLNSFLLGEISDISRNRGKVSSQKSVTRSELELMMSEQCAS